MFKPFYDKVVCYSLRVIGFEPAWFFQANNE
jgi:hypothetical protein